MVRTLRRFLGELCRDTAGNTLMITAGALLMLIAAIGGGVDMSRAYMTKTNLQSACDAGVLAGRKALTESTSYGEPEKAKALKMFTFNMKAQESSATSVVFTSVGHDDGSVTATATATMPTVIMGMFGNHGFDLSVTCSAELQMANADVIFVLDTTLSMNCAATAWSCISETNEKASSRLSGLRDAVRTFHRTVAKAVIDDSSTVIRYAFVPYSSSVNVSGLVASGKMPATWFANSNKYWSRTYKIDTDAEDIADISDNNSSTYGSNITQNQCNQWGVNNYPTTGPNPVLTGTKPAKVTVTTYRYRDWNKQSGNGNTALGTCRRYAKIQEKTYPAGQYTWTQTTAPTKIEISTAGLIGTSAVKIVDFGGSAPGPTWRSPTAKTYNPRELADQTGTSGIPFLTGDAAKWDGCIEERGWSIDSVKDSTWDMNITDAPVAGNFASQWKPHWPRAVHEPTTLGMIQCPPSPITQFKIADTTSETIIPAWIETFLTNLKAAGHTYHDIGMIWGARMGSTSGMFSDNVNNATKDDGTAVPRASVSRHIIFMTDGAMKPANTEYTAYGLEGRDKRVGGVTRTDTQLITDHNTRFLAACRKAEAEGYTVWVVAFADDVTTQMKQCATGGETGGRFYEATDTTGLQNAFKFIAGQVADLRIDQ